MRNVDRLFLILFIAVLAANAQSDSRRSELPRNPLLTSDLIAWTEMQTPDPAQRASENLGSQANTGSNPVSATGDNQAVSQFQAFSGTIVKEGTAYFLRTADKWSYGLDNRGIAAQFVDREVVITGTLNSSRDLIYIHDVQPIP